MEIQNHPSSGAGSRGRVTGELQADLTRSNREGIERAVEKVEAEDRVDLSQSARSFSRSLDEVAEESAEHRRRVEELRAEHERGTLNDRERIERAAEGLLSDR